MISSVSLFHLSIHMLDCIGTVNAIAQYTTRVIDLVVFIGQLVQISSAKTNELTLGKTVFFSVYALHLRDNNDCKKKYI